MIDIEKVAKNKVAVAYCRVSVADKNNPGLSIESQETFCRQEAEKEGYKILKIIKDEGKSGGSLGRSGIQEVIQLAKGKKIDACFVTHTDRLSRQTMNYLYLLGLFRENGVTLKCIYQPVSEEDNSTSRFVNTMFGAVNQMQRDQTAEKVKQTMHEKARAGYFPGIAPIGYDNVRNPNRTVERVAQKIVVPNKMALLVKKSFELYATGDINVFELGDKMYEEGLRSKIGTKIPDSRMYEAFTQPVL